MTAAFRCGSLSFTRSSNGFASAEDWLNHFRGLLRSSSMFVFALTDGVSALPRPDEVMPDFFDNTDKRQAIETLIIAGTAVLLNLVAAKFRRRLASILTSSETVLRTQQVPRGFVHVSAGREILREYHLCYFRRNRSASAG